jgi:hypothetical protein
VIRVYDEASAGCVLTKRIITDSRAAHAKCGEKERMKAHGRVALAAGEAEKCIFT